MTPTPPPEWLAKALAIINALSGWALFAIAVAGIVVLYAPIRVGEVDVFAQMRSGRAGGIWVAIILSGFLALAKLAQGVQGLITRAWQRRAERHAREKDEKEVLAHLDALSQDERQVIAECLSKAERTCITSPMEPRRYGAIVALTSKGLMGGRIPAGFISISAGLPYTIPTFVWDELQKRRESFLPVVTKSPARR